MNTCETCGWFYSDTYNAFEGCGLEPLRENISATKQFGCSHHTAFQRERDRLEIAKAALAGMMADTNRVGSYEAYAKEAVQQADALLAELEKSND